MSKLINLFGGPGIGKSSIASGITYKLKKKHISCNNPYEFPKKLAWDGNLPQIADQLYVFANQHRGIAECYGKVDYIVIDSPILLSTIYHRYYTPSYPAEFYRQPFHDLVIDLHKQYDCINILLKRSDDNTTHNLKERYQTSKQSIDIDKMCKKVLNEIEAPYHEIEVGPKTVKKIMNLLGYSK